MPLDGRAAEDERLRDAVEEDAEPDRERGALVEVDVPDQLGRGRDEAAAVHVAGRVPDPALDPARGKPARAEKVPGLLALQIVPHAFVDGAERADQRIEIGLSEDPELAVVDGDRGHRARGAGDEGAPAEHVAALDHDPPGERVRG